MPNKPYKTDEQKIARKTEYNQKYYAENKDKFEKCREKAKSYYHENKERILESKRIKREMQQLVV